MMWYWIGLGAALAVGLLLGALIGYAGAVRYARGLRAQLRASRELLTGREDAEVSVPYLIAHVQDVLRQGSRLTRASVVARLEEELGHEPGPYWHPPAVHPHEGEVELP